MIELDDVTKSYGDVTPVRGAALRIEDGDFLAVLGPSGCGKTTLLNLMAGLLRPTSGRVVVEGQSLYDLNDRELAAFRRQRFGYVFQSFNLIPYLTASENVEVSLYLAGVNGEQFVTNPATTIKPGSVLLIFSANSGG